MKDLWPLIQQDIAGVIAADALLSTRQVIMVEPGDVESVLDSKVQAAIGLGADGHPGVGFLVLPIEQATDESVSLPGGPLKLTITIQVVENVIVNQGPRGTTIPARVWLMHAERLLKLYTPVGLAQSLVPANPVIHEFTPDRDANLRVGQAEFTAHEADFRPFLRVNRPQIAVSGPGVSPVSPNNYQLAPGASALITVTAPDADPGQIYYTTDNSHPYQGNAAATPYTIPVNITGPCLFRVRAFAHNKAGSDTAAANFFP